jgi:hypothetical protein
VPEPKATQQSLAANGAIVCLSGNLILSGLNADRELQLKAIDPNRRPQFTGTRNI